MKKMSVLMVILILVFIGISFIPFWNTLSFYNVKTKERIAYMLLKEQQSFSIQYTHSIHLSIVRETYEITKNAEIRQTELMYEDFAIGMPSQAEGNESFVQENGKYYIKNMNRRFPEIVLRVGEVAADHHLVAADREIAMTSFTPPGSVIEIKPMKLNIWDKLKGVNIFDGI